MIKPLSKMRYNPTLDADRPTAALLDTLRPSPYAGR